MKLFSKNKKILTKKQKRIKRIITIVIILVLVIIGVRFALKETISSLTSKDEESTYETKEVERRTIENYLSSSGTVAPLDTYSVTTVSSVEGTIISADFEEGDSVNKGDVLYQISTDSMESTLTSAQNSVTRAEKKYKEAVADYNKQKADDSDLIITADTEGYVKTMNYGVGDTVKTNATVADIYDNKYMLLTVPFNASDVTDSLVGKSATVTLSDTDETLKGTVTEIGSVDQTLSGNRIVRTVTIQVKNPGGLAVGTTATANIGSLYSNEEGTFAIRDEAIVTSSIEGEVAKLYVSEGDWVEKGDIILRLTSDTYDNQLETLSDQVDSAKDTLDDAEAKLDEVKENYTDYTITSPITGTIIQKNYKEGDTLSSSGQNTTLCLIYDLSAMTFEMSVDELDVHSVEVGQTVNITADALEDETFEGVITNISLVSTSSGGVTQYPVTVRIDEVGDLLPGMNITGEIVIESVDNALSIPADALMRGNQVYVQDESVTEEVDGVPAGFRAVDVTTGISDDEYVEITEGLSEGDIVYVPARETGIDTNMMMGPGGQGSQGAPNGQGAPGGGQGRPGSN
ncbi:MAG: HlyD family secretion protein [Clostridiales bacterium]|nr:HlyD family secretion protein [Clostridiales bacterium]